MHKFKVGDKVVRCIYPTEGMPLGAVGVIDQVYQLKAFSQIKIGDGLYIAEYFELHQEPHKWRDEIIHWANGGEIQIKRLSGCGSYTWDKAKNPAWNQPNLEFRIKPDITPEQEEIERIEGEMRKLSDDLAKLRG